MITDQEIQQKWNASAVLRAEFQEFNRFAAYMRASESRKITFCGTSTVKPAEVHDAAGVDPNCPLDTRMVETWGRSPELQSEFGSAQRYLAYRKHTDRR